MNDGDQVITSGVMKVRPGAPAKVAAPQAAPPQGDAQQATQKKS
jgi:hypothetical protein